MYEIVKIQMHFQSNYLIFLLHFFYRYVILEKKIKIEIHLFSFGQSMKKKKVKVGYFCKQQKMMGDNVVNLSHIFCQ
jgi:hypothetical protein